jgi:hypothetical protein
MAIQYRLAPKEITVQDRDGKDHEYTIHRFSAVDGREVLNRYPPSNLTNNYAPKLGDYDLDRDLMLKLMRCVAKKIDGRSELLWLDSAVLVNNHVPDAVLLVELEKLVFEYNFGFFPQGRLLAFLNNIALKATDMISKISIPSSGQSSPAAKQPSTN